MRSAEKIRERWPLCAAEVNCSLGLDRTDRTRPDARDRRNSEFDELINPQIARSIPKLISTIMMTSSANPGRGQKKTRKLLRETSREYREFLKVKRGTGYIEPQSLKLTVSPRLWLTLLTLRSRRLTLRIRGLNTERMSDLQIPSSFLCEFHL